MRTKLKLRCYFDHEDVEVDKESIIEYLADIAGPGLKNKTPEELIALLNNNNPDGFYYEYLDTAPICLRCEIIPND